MRVLVTGAAGMIGRRVVAVLRARGDAVAGLDDLSSGMSLPDGLVESAVADVCAFEAVSALCRTFRPQAIVHLAAMHDLPRCEVDRLRCLQVNVVGTESVLQAAATSAVETVVIASSGAVYAWEAAASNEARTATTPRDNYAFSKLCNEDQLRLWCERTGGRGRAARMFNVIAHDDPSAHLVPHVLAQVATQPLDESVIRLGNVQSRRDYMHADDAAAGLVALLEDARPSVLFDAFNLCTGTDLSVSELVAEMGVLLQRQLRIEVDPGRKRALDRALQLGDPAKAAEVLGWRVRWNSRAALARTVMGISEH